jgi:hypothetical protein
MHSRSKPISIYLEHCVSRSNRLHAVHVISAREDAPGGLLQITHFLSEYDALAGLFVQFNPYDALRIYMKRSALQHSARNSKFFTPLFVQGVCSGSRPAGNIHFDRVTVQDEIDRPCFKISDRQGNGVRDITGTVILEHDGQRRTITIDDAWLREMSAATHP